MALDIPAIAAAGVNQAWAAAASVLTACTLRTEPTPTLDTTTDEETITWEDETALTALIYGVEQAEKDGPSGDKGPDIAYTGKALLRASDTAGLVIDHRSQLNDGTNEWLVSLVEIPPGDAIQILHLHR